MVVSWKYLYSSQLKAKHLQNENVLSWNEIYVLSGLDYGHYECVPLKLDFSRKINYYHLNILCVTCDGAHSFCRYNTALRQPRRGLPDFEVRPACRRLPTPISQFLVRLFGNWVQRWPVPRRCGRMLGGGGGGRRLPAWRTVHQHGWVVPLWLFAH